MSKTLPKELTSYDLLKTFAVVIMVIDHVGFYFFPDDNWWRAVGRIGFPIWFFLVGHAKGRDIGWTLWLGALLLLPSNPVAGLSFFPLSALATIIVIRMALEPLMQRAMYDVRALAAFSCLLFLLIFPTSMFFEYGTQGIILAMFGYMVRYRETLGISWEKLSLFAAFCLSSFVITQHLMFAFSEPQLIFMIAGTLFVTVILCLFRSVQYAGLTRILPVFFVRIFQFGGRRTLEIYVVHLLAFKAVGMVLDPERFTFLEWDWFFTGL